MRASWMAGLALALGLALPALPACEDCSFMPGVRGFSVQVVLADSAFSPAVVSAQLCAPGGAESSCQDLQPPDPDAGVTLPAIFTGYVRAHDDGLGCAFGPLEVRVTAGGCARVTQPVDEASFDGTAPLVVPLVCQ